MLKIKDTEVNNLYTLTLVVTSATARETRNKKPYLALELFDGTDKIQGNYWDWTSGKIPANNTVLDVTAQVTEYMGAKQLNIKALSTNASVHLSEFEPAASNDLTEIYKDAYSIASELRDPFLRTLSLEVLEQLMDLWCKAPGAKGVHHAFVGGTLVHSVSVAKIAMSISRNIPESNDELCFVGGLLHDVGKLFTYRVNGVTIDMTDDGMLFDHTFIGAEFIGGFIDSQQIDSNPEKIAVLRHIVLSHHGLLEYGAAVTPMCIEAHIVHHADGVDASTQQIIEASRKLGKAKWTDRIYTLGNRPQLTVQYMKDVMAQEATNEYA